MPKGKTYQGPLFRYKDPYNGREVLRLTDTLGHSHHSCFTL